jgi:hypothetical protein
LPSSVSSSVCFCLQCKLHARQLDECNDTIELRSQADSKQLAFGEIKADGKFKIDSLVNGSVVHGAAPGVYSARIVISDDDYEHKKLSAKSIPKKYFQFETSGLSVTIPSTGVTLQISK